MNVSWFGGWGRAEMVLALSLPPPSCFHGGTVSVQPPADALCVYAHVCGHCVLCCCCACAPWQVASPFTTLYRNAIGMDAGKAKAANKGSGILVDPAAHVGCTSMLYAQGWPCLLVRLNVLSGNEGYGLAGAEMWHAYVAGNYIGTDDQGNKEVANRLGGIKMTKVASTFEANVISGNGGSGVDISWPDDVSSDMDTAYFVGNWLVILPPGLR